MENSFIKKAKWIHANNLDVMCPVFRKKFTLKKEVEKANLQISARGIFTAKINQALVSDDLFMPGFTQADKRLLYCDYDITRLLENDNELIVETAPGWYMGRIGKKLFQEPVQIIAAINLKYVDSDSELITTTHEWEWSEGKVRFADIYDGEIYDANAVPKFENTCDYSEKYEKYMLFPHDGETVKRQEEIRPVEIINTPKGETVLDFGQNLVGTLRTSLKAKKGDKVEVSFAEILDKDGNFYNANYRSARCQYDYTCCDGEQTFEPVHTFYGFRYIRVDAFPTEVNLDSFVGVVIHSDIERTGYIETSNPLLNRLFSNVIWGQKGNYLDVPTDCPQRDERQGWTGDAQVFCKTASYNFQVEKFFTKWMRDVVASQREEGFIPDFIPWPNRWGGDGRCGWGDAIAIIPWQMYLSYGNREIMRECFPAIKRWIEFIGNSTREQYLWTGCWQYGDWLELTAPFGQEKGESRDDIIASAFYANTVMLAAKMGKILGEDVDGYELLYKSIKQKFIETYSHDLKTQTEFVLTLYFGLCNEEEKASIAKALHDKIVADGRKIQTGFLGTPYILHVLSNNGYVELAYELLLRTEYPSWLYPVTKGATTIWEHWDGIMPDGTLWPDKMNSYNHYAYGCVADWLYEVAGGIRPIENKPGFQEVLIAPLPTDKLEHFKAEIRTKHGSIISHWWHEDGQIKYEITTPVTATVIISGIEQKVETGAYKF